MFNYFKYLGTPLDNNDSIYKINSYTRVFRNTQASSAEKIWHLQLLKSVENVFTVPFLLCTAAVVHEVLQHLLNYKLQKLNLLQLWNFIANNCICCPIVHVLLSICPWQAVLCFQNNSCCCSSPYTGHIGLCVTMHWIISVLQSLRDCSVIRI